MESSKNVFFYSPESEKFPYPPEHPFKTGRAEKTREIIKSMGLLTGAERTEFAHQPADRGVVEKFHTPEYLDALQKASRGCFDFSMLSLGLGTGDCPVFDGMYENSLFAAGGTVTGAEMIFKGLAKIAFNPSGGLHHAHAERASGFCYVNDVVLGCMTLAENGKKVLYLDVDVHHGDGVQEAFYGRNDVMTISLHQTGRTIFPGTGFTDEIGAGDGKGFSVNIPLPVGTYDKAYIDTFKRTVLPLTEAFNPDVFVLQLGADGLADDPLAQLNLTNNVYADVIGMLLNLDKPILATGGGGYNVENTTRAWALAWGTLCGDKMRDSLRDRELSVSKQHQQSVGAALEATIRDIEENIFPLHGL